MGGGLLILTALADEARPLLKELGRGAPISVASPAELRSYRGGALTVGWSGVGGRLTRQLLESLRAHPPARILHMGVAGAVRPELQTCDAVLVERAHGPGDRSLDCPPDPELAAQLERTGPLLRAATVSVERIASAPSEKLALGRDHPDAAVVEMECYWAVECAHELGVPITCLRVVIDRQQDQLPDLSKGLDAAGKPRPFALAKALVKKPGAVRQLPQLARAFSRAQGRLGELGRGVV